MKLRRRLNNRGFSLVELLIAAVILAIAVTPLLHVFVTAATTTARSRQIGDATLAGENIAETVESVDLSDLFSEPDPSAYFAGATSKSLYTYDGNSYAPGADPEQKDIYYLGVKKLRAGSSEFNAMIALDANAYRTPEEDGLNDLRVADYSNMDAVYAQSKDADDPDDLGWNSFKDRVNAAHADWTADRDDVIRTITLHVRESGERVYADLDFDYLYSYSYTAQNEETGETDILSGSISSETISYELLPQGYSVEANGALPNIYLMYYPIYGEDHVTNDRIIIRNDIARPFKLFLVKERADNLSGELNYHAAVEQYVPSGTPHTDCARIYTNIMEDLSTPQNTVDLLGVNYKIYSGELFSRTGYFSGQRGELVSKSAENRIYEVTVQIFDSEDENFEEPIYTSHLTKLQ